MTHPTVYAYVFMFCIWPCSSYFVSIKTMSILCFSNFFKISVFVAMPWTFPQSHNHFLGQFIICWNRPYFCNGLQVHCLNLQPGAPSNFLSEFSHLKLIVFLDYKDELYLLLIVHLLFQLDKSAFATFKAINHPLRLYSKQRVLSSGSDERGFYSPLFFFLITYMI